MLLRLFALLLLSSVTFAQAAPNKARALTPEQRTARHFESIKHDPVRLRAFLFAFPKGGDLHNHLSGAVYAETYIRLATEMGLCATKDYVLVAPKQKDVCDEPQAQRPVAEAAKDGRFYNALVDAFSMRNWHPAREAGEYHFFNAFAKFGAVSRAKKGDMLAEAMSRAARENTLYLELMLSVDAAPWQNAAKAAGWPEEGEPDLAALHAKMLAAGIAEAARRRQPALDEMESRARQLLRCGEKDADAGCGVTVRYQSEVHRLGARENVFAQMVWGMELARHDPRVVAINMVQPEDGMVALRDYDLHMRMLDFLHRQYPQTQIALHAGELGLGQVPPAELGTHVPKAIDMGRARRIGHGTDIMHYEKPDDLMQEMIAKTVAVEVSLSSSDYILGLKGAAHPLRAYLRAGVPVVIATDDAGVARSDLTNEYMRAVTEHGLTYAELKKVSRASLEHAFLPGKAAITAAEPRLPDACEVVSCGGQCGFGSGGGAAGGRQIPTLGPPDLRSDSGTLRNPARCLELLGNSSKARLQWHLEQALARFERSH